jgi:hypothetical protein
MSRHDERDHRIHDGPPRPDPRTQDAGTNAPLLGTFDRDAS